MTIDTATRKKLRANKGLSSENKSGSITIDHTLTSGGYIRKKRSAPSNLDEIEKRLNGLDFMIADADLSSLRSELRKVPDLDRALSNFIGKGWPRDLRY